MGVRALALLAALAVAVRAVSWSATVVMMNDGPDFLWQARQILDGRWDAALAHPYHPLYGAVVAAAARLTGAPLDLAAVGASIAGGTVAVLAITVATRRLLDDRAAALGAGFVAAVHPRAVNYSAEVSSDGVFLGLFALALATFLSAADRGSRPRALAAGVCAGLAYLARPEGLFVGAAVALWCAVVVVRERAVGRAASIGAAVALGTALGVAPYVLAIHDATGEWALSMKPSVATVGLTDADGDEPVPDASPHGWPEVVPAPGGRAADEDDDAPRTRVLVLAPSKRDRPLLVTLDVLGGTLRPEGVVLLVVGAWVLARRRHARAGAAALLLVAWCALMVVHVGARGYLSNRHMMVALACALPVAGAGLVSLWTPASSGRRRAARVLAALVVLSMVHYATAPRRYDEVYLAAAARHAAALAEPDASVAIPRRRWGHLTQRRGLVARFPVHEDDMLKKLRREGVTHMITVREDVDPAWLGPERFEVVAVFGPDADDPAHFPTPQPWWWRWGLREPDADDAAVVLRWNGD